MATDKTALMSEMDQARAELWQLVDAVDPATEIYPGWNKRDFFAHIAGWEAFVFECLFAMLHQPHLKPTPITTWIILTRQMPDSSPNVKVERWKVLDLNVKSAAMRSSV